MRSTCNTAERYLKGGGTSSRQRCGSIGPKKIFRHTRGLSPLLGEDVLEGNKEKWVTIARSDERPARPGRRAGRRA